MPAGRALSTLEASSEGDAETNTEPAKISRHLGHDVSGPEETEVPEAKDQVHFLFFFHA